MKELTSANKTIDTFVLYSDAVKLLQGLITIPSFSREESGTADLLQDFLVLRGVTVERIGNNVCARNLHYDKIKPTLLLNSHHDTVKPNEKYIRNPFEAAIEDGKLFGLGSNDAGGCLVSLLSVFLYFYEKEDLKYNLLFAGSGEEEISGTGGVEQVLTKYRDINFAIVGEPTLMKMAVAEKGLLVLDCESHGKAGHAARNEGENAIYKALDDIRKLRDHSFSRISDLLGPAKITVTSISTENKAHNVVPAKCSFVADVRINDLYTHEEILEEIRSLVSCEVKPRSLRMRSSSIKDEHPIVRAGKISGLESYGSPTTSDKALMPFPALKLGPGDSARSHTADEFIYLDEIRKGIEIYIQLLKQIL